MQSNDGTLKKLIKSACGQIKKGHDLIDKVLTWGVELSGWSTMGLVCLPQVEDKTKLVKLGIEDKYLPFFLTDTELRDDDLLKNLLLAANKTEGESEKKEYKDHIKEKTNENTDNEYSELLAWIIGALNCTIESQTFDFASDFQQVTKDLTGNWNENGNEHDVLIQNCCQKCTLNVIPNMVRTLII